jgi:hypothetical protein
VGIGSSSIIDREYMLRYFPEFVSLVDKELLEANLRAKEALPAKGVKLPKRRKPPTRKTPEETRAWLDEYDRKREARIIKRREYKRQKREREAIACENCRQTRYTAKKVFHMRRTPQGVLCQYCRKLLRDQGLDVSCRDKVGATAQEREGTVAPDSPGKG